MAWSSNPGRLSWPLLDQHSVVTTVESRAISAETVPRGRETALASKAGRGSSSDDSSSNSSLLPSRRTQLRAISLVPVL